MKTNGKITLCAMMAAMASVFMLASYFPYLTYAIPAISGLFIMVCVIEIGVKWSVCAYLASAVIVFLWAEPEAKLLYILFFGYYPIIKAVLELRKSRFTEYAVKLVVFNASVLLTYGVLAGLFQIPLDDLGEFGKYSALILLAMANVAFLIYDVAVTRMSGFYMLRLHETVKRIYKGR